MLVKVTKTSDNANKWVDECGFKEGVLGYLTHTPRIGEGITLFHSKDHDSVFLTTTPVKVVCFYPDRYEIETMNSKYTIIPSVMNLAGGI